MRQDKKIVLNKIPSFPDHLCSDEEKATESFGLSMALAIQDEWFYRPSDGTCAFMDRRDKYHNLRLYARGEQSTDIYKKLIASGESSSYTNYDWRPLQIIPKFVKLIVNQMSERLFDVRAEATDKFSTDLKDSYRKNLENNLIGKPIVEEAKNQLGIDVSDPTTQDYPQTQEEIDLFMQLKYKPAIEIATEEAIKFTLDINDYDETQSKVIEDITTIGIGCVQHKTDPTKGILVDYVDPATMVYSYPRSRNFKDVYYYGKVERITINELKRRTGTKYTNDELKDIVTMSGAWNSYHGNSNEFPSNMGKSSGDWDNIMVDVLNFTFQSTNTITYKKKFLSNGGFKMTKKESTFDKNPKYDGYDVTKKVIDVWYEGSLILGTDYVFNYGLCENMIRPKGLMNKTIPNFIMYAPEIYQNRTKSLVERIIPYVDQMQQIHIKIQQMIAKSRPNGIFIDIDGLNEVDLGDGNILTPLETIRLYDETGNIIGTNKTMEGEYNYGKIPITELKNGIVDGLDRLINVYNHYLNLLRDAIGIPQGADASMPHPDTLVGVQQQVALNSNTATRHILDSSLNISERLGLGLSLRLKDIFKYSDLKEAYINALGKINVHILESIKDYHLHDLGINIQLKPDIEEKQYLETNINIALGKELITVDDAIDIRSIPNIKLGNELLKTRRIRREKEKQANAEKLEQIRAQAQVQSTQAAAQAKQQEIQIKSQADLALINAKTEAKEREIRAEEESKSRLMQQEFEYNMTIKGVETENIIMSEKYKEDRKDTRQDKNNTQASKMIEQRNNNSPSLNFESNVDNINGDIGLGEFEPQ